MSVLLFEVWGDFRAASSDVIEAVSTSVTPPESPIEFGFEMFRVTTINVEPEGNDGCFRHELGHGVSIRAMGRSVGIANKKFTGLEAIGVDEIQYRRGHRYLTLVYQIDAGSHRLLYVAKDRTEDIQQVDSAGCVIPLRPSSN